MKNKFYLYCILCFLFNVAGYSQSTIFESLSFESNKLGRKVSYSIYLPSDYSTSKRNYPVLYLLHGYTDNETNWIQMGQMKTIADRAIANEEAVPMIIVMPDAWDTWYINQYDGKVPYEDMFFEELIPYMEKTYRIRSDKESRAIAGLSMGGGGATNYGQRHSDMFCAVYAMSALMSIPEQGAVPADDPNSKIAILTRSVIENSCVKYVMEADEDRKADLRSVAWFVDCGDDDFLLDRNIEFYQAMRNAGVPCQFRVRDGGHDWEYWHSALYQCLPFVTRIFGKE